MEEDGRDGRADGRRSRVPTNFFVNENSKKREALSEKAAKRGREQQAKNRPTGKVSVPRARCDICGLVAVRLRGSLPLRVIRFDRGVQKKGVVG